jgi:hypothetical protein
MATPKTMNGAMSSGFTLDLLCGSSAVRRSRLELGLVGKGRDSVLAGWRRVGDRVRFELARRHRSPHA